MLCRNYVARVEYDYVTLRYHGEIVNAPDAPVAFQSKTRDGLPQAFADSLNRHRRKKAQCAPVAAPINRVEVAAK